jgi:Na+-transporting NADH:ubiquinone oxidoreductase subunit C
MAINKESNSYTIIFALIMVVVVGGLLAFTYESLKGTIAQNEENEKKQNILQAIGYNFEELLKTGEEADADNPYKELDRTVAQDIFYKYVTRRITLSYGGEILSDYPADSTIDKKNKLDAFNIDIRKEYKLFGKKVIKDALGDDAIMAEGFADEDNVHYPLFVCEIGDSTFYVVPAVGTGLWDDVWGYVGLNSDCASIHGAVFDHKGETPGLGSKVTEDWFQDQFVGKSIADDKDPKVLKNLEMKKPGNELNNHQVDGISGATFTGVGVEKMLERAFPVYWNFFHTNPEFIK